LKKSSTNGIVYSTDPSFKHEEDKLDLETLLPGKQLLKVSLDTRNRGGKAVTLVEGFIGKQTDLDTLGKQLKTACGTGGSVKDRIIIIQGDQRMKVLEWLKKNGYLKIK
jgi:translation initiation factor 1